MRFHKRHIFSISVKQACCSKALLFLINNEKHKAVETINLVSHQVLLPAGLETAEQARAWEGMKRPLTLPLHLPSGVGCDEKVDGEVNRPTRQRVSTLINFFTAIWFEDDHGLLKVSQTSVVIASLQGSDGCLWLINETEAGRRPIVFSWQCL